MATTEELAKAAAKKALEFEANSPKLKKAFATVLADRHDNVEDFEAAGGDVGDLPQVNTVTDDNPYDDYDKPNLYLPREENMSLENIEMIRSLKGGETPDQAIATAEQGLVDAKRREDHLYKKGVKDWEEKIYPALSDLLRDSSVYPAQYDELAELQKMGLIKMSPELEKLVGSAMKIRKSESDEFFNVDEIKNLIEDLRKFSRENTSFARRAREFQKKNPGKPYREEGGE